MPKEREPADDTILEAEGVDVDLNPTRVAPDPISGVDKNLKINTTIRDTTPQLAVPVDAPSRLGRYTLLGLLGKGGMAEVYLAKQDGPAGFAKQCVVKRIRRSLAEEPRFVDMFLREARVAARLNHPNAVQIFELGQDGGEYFLAMEFLDGVSLHRAARRSWHQGESVPMEVALRAVADAALGLQHAHSLVGPDGRATPLVHRDVSPDNIILTRDGVSKVLDFGIAKSTDLEEQTGTGEVKGKIPFMSPEQLRGQPLDGRSDLWSLGVTLYWLLTGKRPFDAQTEPMTIDGILRRDPTSPRELNPLIPVPVETLIMKLLDKDREKRVKSGSELADQVLAMLGPSAGYSAASAFAAKAMQWNDADPKQPISALTILAARPESQWLKRLDRDNELDEASGSPKLDRLFPEMTPTGKQRARREPEVSTAGTVTGLAKAQTSTGTKLIPVAAGTLAAAIVAVIVFVVVHGAKDERAVDAEPWVVSVKNAAPASDPASTTATPASTTATPTGATTPPDTNASTGSDDKQHVVEEKHDAPHSAGVDTRVSVKLVAPSKIAWKANGRSVGNGNGSARVSRGTSSLTAIDGETGGSTSVNVVDGVADYGAVPSGTLNVRVKPWADVEIGRRKLGQTPIDPVQLKAGHYTVHLQRDAMQKTIAVDVKPGATATVTADMRD